MILKIEYTGGNNFKLLEAGEYVVKGECKRCGKCCEQNMSEPCGHLIYETVDGVEQTRCGIYPWWPIGCNFYPLPESYKDRPKGCRIKLVKRKK